MLHKQFAHGMVGAAILAASMIATGHVLRQSRAVRPAHHKCEKGRRTGGTPTNCAIDSLFR